jgi:hypothetical protein
VFLTKRPISVFNSAVDSNLCKVINYAEFKPYNDAGRFEQEYVRSLQTAPLVIVLNQNFDVVMPPIIQLFIDREMLSVELKRNPHLRTFCWFNRSVPVSSEGYYIKEYLIDLRSRYFVASSPLKSIRMTGIIRHYIGFASIALGSEGKILSPSVLNINRDESGIAVKSYRRDFLEAMRAQYPGMYTPIPVRNIDVTRVESVLWDLPFYRSDDHTEYFGEDWEGQYIARPGYKGRGTAGALRYNIPVNYNPKLFSTPVSPYVYPVDDAVGSVSDPIARESFADIPEHNGRVKNALAEAPYIKSIGLRVYGGPSYHLVKPDLIDPKVPPRSMRNRLIQRHLRHKYGFNVHYSDIRHLYVESLSQKEHIFRFGSYAPDPTCDKIGMIYLGYKVKVEFDFSSDEPPYEAYPLMDSMASVDLDTYALQLYYGQVTSQEVMLKLGYSSSKDSISDVSTTDVNSEMAIVIPRTSQFKFRLPWDKGIKRVKAPIGIKALAQRKFGSREIRGTTRAESYVPIKKYLSQANKYATRLGLNAAIKDSGLPVVSAYAYANEGNAGVIDHFDFPNYTSTHKTGSRHFTDNPIRETNIDFSKIYNADELYCSLPNHVDYPIISVADRNVYTFIKERRSLGLYAKLVPESTGLEKADVVKARKLGLTEVAATTKDFTMDEMGKEIVYKDGTSFSISGHLINMSILYLLGLVGIESYLAGALENQIKPVPTFETNTAKRFHSKEEYLASIKAVEYLIDMRRSLFMPENIARWRDYMEAFYSEMFADNLYV